MYAFGITIYELISRKEPYSDTEYFDDILPLVANPGPDSSLVRPELPDSCPEELRKIIKECWAHYPDNRPTFEELGTRARCIDLSVFGMGTGTVQDILLDMYPPHVSSVWKCVCVCVCACMCVYIYMFFPGHTHTAQDILPSHVSCACIILCECVQI